MKTTETLYWYWDDTWQCILIAVIAILMALLLATVFAQRKVLGYYLKVNQGTTCIMTGMDWDIDYEGACYQNPNDAIEALQKLRVIK